MSEELDKLREYANKEPSPYLVNPLAPPDQLINELLNKITELEVSEKEFIKGYCDMTDRLNKSCDQFDGIYAFYCEEAKENDWLHKVNKILSFALGVSLGLNIIILRRVFK